MSGPGWSSMVLVAVVVSTGASFGTQWAKDTGRLEGLWAGSGAAPLAAPEPSEHTDVPQLIGLPSRIAGDLLRARNLRIVVTEKRHDADLAAGLVLSQQPLPGSALAANDEITVVLSLGPEEATTVALPDLAGMDRAAANDALTAAGLTLGTVDGPDAGDAVVVSSEPAAGAEVEPGSAVAVHMEQGGVEVPKFVGLHLRKAKAAIKKAGFKVGSVRKRFSEARPPYAVLSQSPEAGSRSVAGATIDLVRNEE